MIDQYENMAKQSINPFTLRAAKTGLTIWEIFHLQKHFLKKLLKDKCL